MAEIFNLSLSGGQQYPYHLVYSKRAKYIRIKLSPRGDLSVTLPSNTKEKYAHQFVDSKKKWIEKHLAKVKRSKKQTIPRSLDLKLLDEVWGIDYSEVKIIGSNKLRLTEQKDHVLNIQGKIEHLNDFELIATTINQWCKKKSKLIFNKMLQETAEIHGFHYNRLSIRSQKTRWGSCSDKRNINLNSKLLFMPVEVVRYVMIHELCHTIEMNHSKKFWALVEDCDPNFKQHKKVLKVMGKSIII